MKGACIDERNRLRSGFKPEFYCEHCRREECIFRPVSPAEYTVAQSLRWGHPVPQWARARCWAQRPAEGYETLEDVRQMILFLLDGGPLDSEALGEELGLSVSAVWRRCNELRKGGEVISKKSGMLNHLVWERAA